MANVSDSYATLTRDTDIFIGVYGMFIIVVGTIGNVLTLIVIIDYHSMKSTTRLLFFTLAASDLVALPLAAVRYWLQAVYHYDLRDKNAVACKLHSFFTVLGLNMAMWTIVLISMERFCQTVLSHHQHPFVTIRWTAFLLFTIFVILVGKNCPLLTRTYEDHHCGKTTLFDLGSVSLTDCLIGYLIPGTLVLVFTLAILLKLRRHHKKIKNGADTIEIGNTKNLMSATLMLLGVALSRLLIGVPGYVANCLSHGSTLLVEPLSSIYRVLLIFMVTNNGANLYIYLITSQGFRKQFIFLVRNVKSRILRHRVES